MTTLRRMERPFTHRLKLGAHSSDRKWTPEATATVDGSAPPTASSFECPVWSQCNTPPGVFGGEASAGTTGVGAFPEGVPVFDHKGSLLSSKVAPFYSSCTFQYFGQSISVLVTLVNSDLFPLNYLPVKPDLPLLLLAAAGPAPDTSQSRTRSPVTSGRRDE